MRAGVPLVVGHPGQRDAHARERGHGQPRAVEPPVLRGQAVTAPQVRGAQLGLREVDRRRRLRGHLHRRGRRGEAAGHRLDVPHVALGLLVRRDALVARHRVRTGVVGGQHVGLRVARHARDVLGERAVVGRRRGDRVVRVPDVLSAVPVPVRSVRRPGARHELRHSLRAHTGTGLGVETAFLVQLRREHRRGDLRAQRAPLLDRILVGRGDRSGREGRTIRRLLRRPTGRISPHRHQPDESERNNSRSGGGRPGLPEYHQHHPDESSVEVSRKALLTAIIRDTKSERYPSYGGHPRVRVRCLTTNPREVAKSTSDLAKNRHRPFARAGSGPLNLPDRAVRWK